MSEEVESPCQKKCQLSQCRAFCIYCWRTMEEIVRWKKMNNEDKMNALSMIETRKKHYSIGE